MALGLASGPGTRDAALRAGALTKVDPGRVSVGVLVNLTGAGFATTAAANEVVFTPQNGSSVTVRANAVATVNEKRGTRRLTVLVPSLPDGPAAVRVVNTVSGEQSTTSTVRIISLTPSVTELQQGETRDLVVTGSAETAFVARTRVALGSGIKVESVVVESPTRLVARVAVATTATVGARTLDVSASGLLARYTGMAVVVRGPANVAPTVNAGADQSITLPAAATLTGSATDDGLPVGSTLTYAWAQVSGPGTATFAAPTSASTSATFSAAGTYVLRLTASDGALSGSDTVTVTVTDAPQTNLAPTVNAGPDQSITLPAAATLTGSATDDGLPVGSTLTYAWAQVSGPGTATFAAPTSASTSATFSAAGTYVLRLTASDGALSGSDTVTVTVTDAPQTNLAPTVNAGPDQNITLPAAAALAGSATDDGLPVGSTLTYAWALVSGPGTATFAAPTSASTSATFSAAGTYVLRLTASDGALSGSDTVTITVTDAPQTNLAPTANAGPDQSITLPAAAALSGSATDDGLPVGSTLTYAWAQVSGPGTATFAASTSASTSATFSAAGTYVLRLTASDGALSGSDTVTVTVNADGGGDPPPTELNRMPTVNAGPDRSVTLPDGVTLAGQVSDDGLPVGSTLTLLWQQVSGPAPAGIVSPTLASSAITFLNAGVYVFRLQANDGEFVDSDEVRITVSAAPPPPNTAPLVDAGPDASVTLPAAITLAATATDDGRPAPASLVVTWSQRSGPGVAVIASPGSSTTTATASVPGTYIFRAAATDGVLTGADEVTIVVAAAPPPTNGAPTVTVTAEPRITLPQVATLRATATDDGLPTPTPPAIAWSQVAGPGVAVFAAPAALTSPVTFSLPGTYELRATASDGELTAAAVVSVVVDPAPPLNTVPRVDAGTDARVVMGTPLPLAGVVTDDGLPDGAALAIQWSSALGPSPVAFAAPGSATTTASFGMPGRYVLELTASDGELVGSDTLVVTVVPGEGGDLLPPVITLDAPARALPGQDVRITARVSDDIGVTAVTFVVDGAEREPQTATPYGITVTLPEVASPGQRVRVRATARDAAGRIGEDEAVIEIALTPDVQSPTLDLRVPEATVPGGTVTALAVATDESGIGQVEFFVDEVPSAVVTAAPYELMYVVPPARPAGPISVRADAVDGAGNRASVTRIVQVSADADTTAPVVSLTAPATASSGATVRLEAVVTDSGGVADVTFSTFGLAIGEATAAPWTTDFVVPELPVGTSLPVKARARDLSGNASEATASIEIVARPTTSIGLVTGQVIDDRTGLPVGAARITILGGLPGSAAAYRRELRTDAEGRYQADLPAGDARVIVERDGYVGALRLVEVAATGIVPVLDARLTPVGLAVPVTPAAGQRLGGQVAQLDLPAGGVVGNTSLTFAAVSGQGLTGLLPAGWTPLGGAHIGPETQAFVVPAVLRLLTGQTTPLTGRSLALVRWDVGAESWRVVSTAVTLSSGVLEHAITSGGQYVLVLADAQPVPPPVAVTNALLLGVDRADVPAALQSAVTPDPRVLFASPEALSLVTGQVTTDAALTSGLPLQVRLVESYRFLDGEEWQPLARLQDVVLYQQPATPLTVSAQVPVGPTRAFDAVLLQRGVIAVELRTPEVSGGGIVGGDGGTVTGDNDVALEVPAGAIDMASQVAVRRVAVDTLPPVPSGVTALEAIEVVLPGLTQPAGLSLPRPAGLIDASRVVLARVREINGRTRYELAGLIEPSGDRVRVTLAASGVPTGLPGVRMGGTYVLLQASAPLGFAAGLVVDPVGRSLPGAVVTPGTFPVVSVASAAGAYFVAAPTGAVVLAAADEVRGDRGERPAFLLAQVVTPLTLTVLPVPPTVTSLRPADGARGVLVDDPITVTFSEAVQAASLTVAVRLVGPGDVEVPVTTALTRGGTVLEVRPVAPLSVASRYVLTLAASITDLVGNGMAAVVSSTFDTLDQNGPEVPPAGTITASVPDAGGRVTVRGSQGSAAVGYQVFAENLTRRTSAFALVNADGSFATGLLASVSDRLRVRIVEPSGNTTTVDIETLRQVNPDGSISQVVAEAGGVVEGPEGTRATVKPGTFPGGTVVTMKALPVREFPRQLTPAEAENFSFEKAISLDFDGATPQQYIDVSWPAAPTDKSTDQWVLTESIFAGGEWAMNVVDTVKYRDGRLTTASPPCPGVTAAATYGLLKSVVPYGLNYAQMYADGRYKLKMTMEVFQGSPIAIPYAAFSTELPRSICFPAFVGRMSITPNSTRITVSGTDLRPEDVAIEVTSSRRDTPVRFDRKVAPFHLRVFGFKDDAFVVYAVGPGNADGKRVRSTRYNQPNAFVDLGDIDRQIVDFVLDAAAGDPLGTQTANKVEPVTLVVDPADVDVPVTSFKVVALRANRSSTMPVRDQLMTVNVPGGGDGETYTVKAVSRILGVLDGKRDVPFLAVQAVGPGNLVLRATPGTIDPTREEMGTVSGPARTKFTLTSDIPGFTPIVVPPDRIVQGGLEFAFDGIEGANYTVITEYDTRPPFALQLPTVRYVLRNVNTSQVLRTIFGQAPPRDEPVELPALTDDTVAPTLLAAPTRMDTFDPAGLLTFRFSESMNPASLRNAVIVRDGTQIVKGQVRISDQNRVLTFVPDVPLDLDNRYTVEVIGGDNGARDLAGNVFEETVSFQVTTFTPRSLGVTTGGEPALIFKDTAWLFRDDGTTRRRHLFTVLGGQVDNVRWFDGTDPGTLAARGRASSAPSLQRIAAIETDKIPALGDGKQMLVATTMFDVTRSALTFFRATEPGQLQEVGGLPLTKNVSTFNPLDTTVRGIGYARNVVLHETADGVRAIVAVEKFGVMSADVGRNIGALLERTENAYPLTGVVDIAGYGEGVVAVARTPEGRTFLAQLGASLDLVGQLGLPFAPRSVAVGRAVAIDINRDGQVTPDERGDVAVVGTHEGVHVVRLARTDGTTAPTALFSVTLGGVVKQIEIDEERSRVIAIVDESVGSFLHIVDLARGEIDPPAEGTDPRVIFRRQFPAGANGMRLDKQAGLLYIPTPTGLDTWLIADRCCDLGVELTADLDKKAKSVVSGDLGDVLQKELAAIKRGVVLGLRRAEERCEGFDVSKLKLIESGSSGCLWSADPVRACGSNYQPLVSDHDISTFMPDDWYQREVNDPDWDGEGTPKKVLLAGCVVAALTYPFTDPYTEEPKPVGESGLVFKDISFIPNYVADFDSMEYRLERTIEGLPGDVDNDLAMGRQLLVMKHLTEAYGVDLRGTEGYRTAYAAVMVDEDDFESRFERFRTVTRIPQVEGYEWGVLMQFMLAKAKAYVRFKGAADERSTFNDLYVKQFHTAAKAGIRAAAARIVADPDANRLFLDVTREGPGNGLLVFRENACLVYQPGQDPTSWPAKSCGSMEEYVAATAVRSLSLPTPFFTRPDIELISKFYRVKADEQPILTEAEADAFIAQVHNFVMRVKQETYPIYAATVGGDRRAAERLANREYAEGVREGPPPETPGGRIDKFLQEWNEEERAGTKFTVKPKVYNRGFMSAPHVYLRAYVADQGEAPALACVGEPAEGEDPDPALVDRCRLALNLNGGALIYPAYRDGATGAYVPQPNSRSVDAFPLKVDQRKTGTNGYIVFTLDLPERSANEADRTNNVGGAQYYILDPGTGTAPPLPAEPPSPVNPQLLAPDPYCLKSPQLTVTQSVIMDGKEKTSPVQAYLGARFELNIKVTNTGSSLVEDVLACSSLIKDPQSSANAAWCLNVGDIGPGATTVRKVAMAMPATPTNFESVATATSSRLGISSASLLRISAKCEPMLVPLSPDPNALAEAVGRGGRAVRHFMAIHPVTGEPAVGVRVVVSGQYSSLGGLTYVSGSDGLIDTTLNGRTIDGLAVPTVPGREETWKLERVNDLLPQCGSSFEFKAQGLNTFRFTQAIEAGSAITAGLKMFNLGPSGEASFGGGLRIEAEGLVKTFPAGTGEAYVSAGDDLANITWERKAAVGVSGSFRFPGFSAAGEFGGQYQGKAEGLKLDLTGSASATQAYRYFFPGNPTSWGPAQRGSFAALLFPSVSESEAATFRELDAIASDPLFRLVLEQVYGAEAPYRPYRTNRVGALAVNGAANAVGFKGSIDFVDKTSQDKANPAGKENETTPLFSASAEGSAAMAIGYEKDERLKVTAVDETVQELVHTIDIDGKYDWKSSYATSFERASGDIDAGNQAPEIKAKAKELLKWAESRLSNSETGKFDGGIRFRVFAKPVDQEGRTVYRVSKLEVGFRTQKTYGFTPLGGAPVADSGNDYRINFVIEGEGEAEWILNQAIGRGAVFVQLLSDAQKVRTTEFLNALGGGDVRDLLTEKPSVFSADQLYDQLVAFIRSVFLASTVNRSPAKTSFYEEVRRARATETDFGVGIAAKAKAIGFSIAPLRVEYASWHPSARGVIVGGAGYLLEDYSSIAIAPPDGEKLFLDIAELELNKLYDGLGTQMRAGWEKRSASYNKGDKASVTPTASADLNHLDVASWAAAPRPAAPATPTPYLGYGDSAPAGKPQYGIGDFYSLVAAAPLSAPVTISIGYDEAELTGVSESTLGLYRWNNPQRDWDLVAGATVDTTANRVTATVSDMGLYTLGTRMPAGKLTWQVVSWSSTGDATTVTLRASGLRMNDGSPLPPGTLMHVAVPGVDPSTASFGGVDASPRPGHQVTADGTGLLTVTVTLPGQLATLDIVGFSDLGTAFGEATVVRP